MHACSGEKSAKQEAQEKRGTPEPEVFTAGCNFVKMTCFALEGEL